MPRRHVIRGRLRRQGRSATSGEDEAQLVEIEPGELAGVFAAPQWLRDLGLIAWLLVGITLLLVGAIWLLALTNTIVIPVLTATVIAAVLSPVIGFLERRRIPRAAGTAIVLLLIVALAALVTVVVLAGIASEADSLRGNLQHAVDTIQGWLKDLGVDADKAQRAADDASSTVSGGFDALLKGLATGIEALASLAVFLSFTVLSLFFLLKDGPTIRGWAQRHMGVPLPVAQIIVGRTLQSLRGYFAGVTAVAGFNAIVIGLGALVLGVPLAGSIAVINFLAAYVPYLGAWSAGAFTVLIALGGQGTETALVMAVIVLLANGALQQMIQPIAFGAALGIHPLAVLIVTIAGGSLFGTIGLVLAAPLTSAALRVSSDLARARAAEEGAPPDQPQGEGPPPAEGPPAEGAAPAFG